MRFSLALIAAAHTLTSLCNARDVFSHYLLGTITKEHAAQDISDAKAMGLDAFALNIANPSEKFVGDALSYLFDAAKSQGFKLFLSMDLYAQGDACYKSGGKTACGGPSDFSDIIKQYRGSGAYYMGPDGNPFVSTFSAAKWSNATFINWRKDLGFPIYFAPDFDATQGYNTGDPGWYEYWGPVLDSLFSWEFSWPVIGAFNDGDVSTDAAVLKAAHAHKKTYIIGLSMLQYKNSYDTNLYRRGELNLPKRMENILSMSPLPDYVEIISWNDGPEGHYIGNLWPEQNTDAQPDLYASQSGAPHNAIQGVLTSFINAFKAGKPASAMQPAGNGGAMWYKTVFQSVKCADDGMDLYLNHPNGSQTGQDVINYAVVLPQGTNDTIKLISNGEEVLSVAGKPGLNYGQSNALHPGTQRMIVGGAHTSGGRCVNSACQDDIYNYNPQIVGLQTAKMDDCWAPNGQGRAIKQGGKFIVTFDPASPYMTKDCSDDAVTNRYRESRATLWKDLDCQDAWSDGTAAWVSDDDKPKNFEFTEELAEYFNVTNANWGCRALHTSGTECQVPISCSDAKWPAGWVIMNSIAGLESTIALVGSYFDSAESYTSDRTPALVSAFGNIQDNKVAGILSIVSVGLGILGTPVFGDIIKGLNNFGKGLGDTVNAVKDTTTNLAGQAISQANLVMGGSDQSISEANTLQNNIAGIVHYWKQSLADFNDKLFDESSDSITQILHYIVNGTFFFGGASQISSISVEIATERALFPLLIAQLWILGGAPAFILDADKTCDANSKAPKAPTPSATYMCVGGKAYFLSAVDGSAYKPSGCNPSNPRQICIQADFSTPPGYDKLDGSDWGNVSWTSFLSGSVNTYNNNGQKNGVGNPPDFAKGIVDEIYDHLDDINMIYNIPGVFTLPVCKETEARQNWKETKVSGRAKTPNYPCN